MTEKMVLNEKELDMVNGGANDTVNGGANDTEKTGYKTEGYRQWFFKRNSYKIAKPETLAMDEEEKVVGAMC